MLTTKTEYSNALQLADCVVGAMTDFFKWVYKNKSEEQPKDFFRNILNYFDCKEGKILGVGIIVPKEDRKKVKEYLDILR